MTERIEASPNVDQYAVALQRALELRARTEKIATILETLDLDDDATRRSLLSRLITIQRMLRSLQEDAARLLAACAWGKPSDFNDGPVPDTGHLTKVKADADELFQQLIDLVRLQKALRLLARQVQIEGLALLIDQDANAVGEGETE